ncbi:MAG: hypothetical protein AB8G11_23425 [Saprospiraceae bacterium]
MKQTKVIMFLAFIFCMSFSMSSFAAVEMTVNSTETIAKNEVVSKKSLKKQVRKQWKKVLTKVKDVKKTLKEKAENASNGQLLLLALVGLGCLVIGLLLGSGFIWGIGSLLITIAIVWWILKLIGIV